MEGRIVVSGKITMGIHKSKKKKKKVYVTFYSTNLNSSGSIPFLSNILT